MRAATYRSDGRATWAGKRPTIATRPAEQKIFSIEFEFVQRHPTGVDASGRGEENLRGAGSILITMRDPRGMRYTGALEGSSARQVDSAAVPPQGIYGSKKKKLAMVPSGRCAKTTI